MIGKPEAKEITKQIIAQAKGGLPLEFTVMHMRLALLYAEKARVQREIDKAEVEFSIYQQRENGGKQ